MDTAALMDKLFKWKGKVEYEGITFYIRVVSDAVIEDARKYALLESRKLRKNLRNKDSDDYLIHIDQIEDLTDDEIRVSILNLASRDVAREFVQSNPKPALPSLGDYPSQEDLENHEAAKLERDSLYIDSLQSHLKVWQDAFTLILNRQDRASLESMYQKHKVDRVCEDVFASEFENYIISKAVYKDSAYKDQMLTLEDYINLPSNVKILLREKYNSLTMDGESIKN